MIAALSGCSPKRVALPSGDGTPFPGGLTAYEAAVHDCRRARTLSGTLGLSGRAGSTPVRGNVDAGFEAPDNVRLEGRYPFGRPAFVLVATGPKATLSLPRDNRILRDASTADIVEALVGLPLGGAELRLLVSGCGFQVADPSRGREFPDGWVAVDTGSSTTYLRQVKGQWRIVAATRPPLAVHYADFTSGRASTLRIQATGASRADITARISDLNINVPLESAVFQVDDLPGAEPLTLDQLRRAGPLGGQ